MSSTGSTDPVGELLAAEWAALKQFRDLLVREQAILQQNQADLLPAMSQEKAALASQLGDLLQRRERALATAGCGSGRQGMESWMARLPAGQRQAQETRWNELLLLTRTCRDEHALNGKLIALQLARTQQALSALMLAGGQALTYGPDGQQHVGLGGGRTLGSA